MSDTNKLIKNAVIDIICVTSLWSLLNNPHLVLKYNNTLLTCGLNCLGTCLSLIVVFKYL